MWGRWPPDTGAPQPHWRCHGTDLAPMQRQEGARGPGDPRLRDDGVSPPAMGWTHPWNEATVCILKGREEMPRGD